MHLGPTVITACRLENEAKPDERRASSKKHENIESAVHVEVLKFS